MNPQAAHAGAILTVNLDAIRSNYRLLRQQAGKAACAAAVKANAYGLGADKVGRRWRQKAAAIFSSPIWMKASPCARTCRPPPTSLSCMAHRPAPSAS